MRWHNISVTGNTKNRKMYVLTFLLPILLIAFLDFCDAETCPDIYRRYSRMHTYCKSNNTKCDIKDSGVNSTDKQLIVNFHNSIRNKVAIGREKPLESARGMLIMQWDDNMADLAQKHANQCPDDSDCEVCRQTHAFEDVGQSLYISTSNSKNDIQPDWNGTLTDWYDERENQRFNRSSECSYHPKEETDEFTQMIWAATWRIGCGYVIYQTGKVKHQTYVCNYGPGGNADGDPIYDVGVINSKFTPCPENTCRFSDCREEDWALTKERRYYGLCNVLKDKAPQPPKSKGLEYYCNFENMTLCNVSTVEDRKEWQRFHTLSGAYMGLVIKGNYSFLRIHTPMKIEPELCVRVEHRGGPNSDGDPFDYAAFLNRYDLNDKFLGNEKFTFSNDTEWRYTFFNLVNKDGIRIELNFINLSKKEQFFEVREILVSHCQANPRYCPS